MSDDKITYKSYALNILGDETKAEGNDTDSPCEYCGGWPDGMEEKSVRQKRQARYMALKLRLQTAKITGMTHKVWKTIGDGRIRKSHVKANRQRVLIDSHFKIGNELLYLPSDPSASFAETANCRCDVYFVKRSIADDTNNIPSPIKRLYEPNVPISGQVSPLKLNPGKDQKYDFVAGRYVKVIISTANAIPTQVSGFRINGLAYNLDKNGDIVPSLAAPDFQLTNAPGGHVTNLRNVVRLLDAGVFNKHGFRWILTLKSAVASDNQGPVFFQVIRDG